MLTHRQHTFVLDNAFALIEGHPPCVLVVVRFSKEFMPEAEPSRLDNLRSLSQKLLPSFVRPVLEYDVNNDRLSP